MSRFLFVVPPFTGHVNPTIGVALELRARVRSREGRKCFIEATLSAGGEVGPTAEALFIVPREHAR